MKKLLKVLFKITVGLVAFVLLAFGILYAMYDQKLPEGKSGEEADSLAANMLKSLDYEAYQKTRFLEWSFAGGSHNYKWDKQNGKVEVKWSHYTVNLNLGNASKSLAFKDNLKVVDNSKKELIETATNYFNNDSFWLVAPFKVFDTGTKRDLVILEDGSRCLLVTYSEGGTTPGDAYLWKFLPNGFPKSYQMWVKIIPIGGIEATWEDWKELDTGVFLPGSHSIGPMTLHMGQVKAYN